MANEKEEQQNQINIELSEEIAEGVYSNLAMIAHSNSEFVIDFIRLMPGVPKAKVKSRIVVTPEHAKRLLFALKDKISYEFWWYHWRSLKSSQKSKVGCEISLHKVLHPIFL